jgi:hypothetical protein
VEAAWVRALCAPLTIIGRWGASHVIVPIPSEVIEALRPFAAHAESVAHLDDDEPVNIVVTAGDLKRADHVVYWQERSER